MKSFHSNTKRVTFPSLAIVACAFLMTAACGDDDDDDDYLDASVTYDASLGFDASVGGDRDAAVDAAIDASADEDANVINLTDSQIAKIMLSANLGEVQVGKLAMTNASSAQVDTFASQMVTAHQAAHDALVTELATLGITPAASADDDTLQSMTSDALHDLDGLSGMAFDTAYMQSQLDMHAHVLKLIDEQLLPDVTNVQLHTRLQEMRTVVQSHLTTAEGIAGALDLDASL
jgi:putative membrane protein